MQLIIPLLLVFLAAAFQDYRKREVSDYLTIAAWVISAFMFNMQTFALVFAGAWAISAACERIKKPIAAFGDVLWAPVFYMAVETIGFNGLVAALIAMLGAQLALWYELAWNKKPQEKVRGSPFVLVMFLLLVVLIGMSALGL